MSDAKKEETVRMHPITTSPSESRTPSTSSTNFRTVKEEPWGSRIEKYLREVMKLCEEKSQLHDEAGYFFKKKKNTWGVPMVLVPAIFSPLTLMIAWNRNDTCDTITFADYFNAIGFMLTAFFTTVYGWYDYGMKYQLHFNHAYIFGSIHSKIKAEMVKHRRFRLNADVFMVQINMELDNAIRNEPVLPKSIIKKDKEENHGNGMKKRFSNIVPPMNTE